VERPALGSSGKNGSDIKMSIDAFELATSNPNVNYFALVTGDSDFLPLIQKLREKGKYVIIISAEKSASDLIKRNCDRYLSYDTIANLRKGETEIIDSANLLDQAVRSMEEKGERTLIAMVKQRMLQLDSSFDEKRYGFDSFKEFIKSIAEERLLPVQLTGEHPQWTITRVEVARQDSESTKSKHERKSEDRAPTGQEMKIAIEAIEQCLQDGRGKLTEGRIGYLFSYLEGRRVKGEIRVPSSRFGQIISRLVTEGLLVPIDSVTYRFHPDYVRNKELLMKKL